MGVHGLWKLLEPSGEPVALENLENKVLAIDVSMWLHQVLKGYHDGSGNAIPNAHLIGLFHRICKLMYFGIKPVFVFDGGVPMLKQQTMINRKKQKKTAGKRAQDERMRLLRNLMEQDILQRVRGNTTGTALLKMPGRKDEVPSLFELPQDEPDALRRSDAEGEETESSDDDIVEIINWDNFDPNSREFKMLPALKRLEILNDLKESRKQGSWRRMHDMPQESGDFSCFQMKRLLVRRSAQVEMEEAEKELSKSHTLSMEEIKAIMAEKGSLATKLCEMDVDYGSRIASDNVTRLIMITNPKKGDAKLAIEEETVFEEEPAIKVKIEVPERMEEDKDATDRSNAEIPEIVVSDDEIDRSFVEQMFVSNIEQQVNKSDLTQEEILALIENGMSEGTRTNSNRNIVDFNQPSTSKASFSFVQQINLDKETPSFEPHQSLPNETSKSSSAAADLLKLLTSEPEPTKVIETSAISVPEICEFIPVEKPIEALVSSPEPSSKEKASLVDYSAEPELVPQDKAETELSSLVEEQEKSLEINIKPEEVVQEDDIFSGVFSAPEETGSVAASPASAIGIMSCSEESSSELEGGAESPAIPEVPVEDTEEDQQVENEDLPPHKTDFRSMSFTDEEMKLIEERLAKEQASIVTEIGRQERIATNLSNQICNEAQELIALFGLPFVVAPMEAEAQCAMLDLLSLTNGTVTDDSDIWLFGGRTVYRNFFNQAKNVERYTSESISKNFKLSRDRLILLAMLVGSDYTIGLQGVGPVTALEIIAEFATNRIEEIGDPEELVIPLKRFRQWWQSKEMTNIRRRRLKNSLKELHFHEGFPSEAVVDAYVHPQVNDSKDKFSWDKPNIDGLIEYSNLKFGWSKSHAESVLDPVIKRQGETKVQGRIDSYFNVQTKAKELDDLQLSSRVRKAVTQLDTVSQSDDEVVEPQPSTSKRVQKEGTKEAPQPKRGKKIQNNSKLNEFKQQFTKKPKPLKEAAIELKPKSSANVPKLEKIPQREKNKESALQSKLKAIEIFRKRKIDPVVKPQRHKRVVAKDDHLSESSDSD